MENWKCCNVQYNNLKDYFNHLNLHKHKPNFLLKCDLCGTFCNGWLLFKRHFKNYHKNSNLTILLESDLHSDNFEMMDYEDDDDGCIKFVFSFFKVFH